MFGKKIYFHIYFLAKSANREEKGERCIRKEKEKPRISIHYVHSHRNQFTFYPHTSSSSSSFFSFSDTNNFNDFQKHQYENNLDQAMQVVHSTWSCERSIMSLQ